MNTTVTDTLSSSQATPPPSSGWREALESLGPGFAERSARHDAEGTFVARNYAELKERGIFSTGVPAALGGAGVSHSELCELLRTLARWCPSTALAVSMHTHLVATSVWKWRKTGDSEALLRRVAAEQMVLVSTGATDWVASNGEVERVDGGFRVTARKVFASGSPAADLLITSAPWKDPEAGWVVLHFPVAFSADGVRIADDWDALGMRGTGSHTVHFDRVFVPESAVALRRARDQWPAALSVVMTVALPLIMSVYLGVAERAAETAVEHASGRAGEADTQVLVGEMQNALLAADLAVSDMVRRAADYDFEATVENANRALQCKTLATSNVIRTVDKAVELTGGAGFYRRFGLERLLRDIRAAHYHPLPEKRQLRFTGRVALGLDPC